MTGEIERLLELQDKDRECEELTAQIAHLKRQRVRLTERREQETARVEEARHAVHELERESRQRNLDVDELDAQIHAYQKQLDEGIISFKEMESLREKIANQRARINQMEDEALLLMDKIVAEQENLAHAEEELSGRLEEPTAQDQALEQRIAAEEAKLAAAKEERARIAASISPSLLARYENLRRSFTDPVVPIKNGICTGCKLRVSGHTVERARNTDEIVTCENCSRILYIR